MVWLLRISVMCVCLVASGPVAQAQTDGTIAAQLSLLKEGQLDVYELSDEQVEQLIEAADQEILDERLRIYPENKYYDEYPWRRGLIDFGDEKRADALARLYLRKGGNDFDFQRQAFVELKDYFADVVPADLQPPQLSEIDFDKLATDAEAMKALLEKLWTTDQFFNGMISEREDTYEVVQSILGGRDHWIGVYDALLAPINFRHKAQLAAIAERIILTIGWPNPEDVGRQASQALWLIIQHQDTDPDLQMAVLPILKTAVEEKGVSPNHYAYLEDRINTNHGRLQRFGTQVFGCNKDTLVDANRVDAWREEYGLKPLSEFLERYLAHRGVQAPHLTV